MGVTVDEYIPLEARVNPDGSVDVLIDGAVLPGGSGLAMASVLQLLTRYAGENGKLLMTTTHPNGRVTRDLVAETGEITPFYPEVKPRQEALPPAAVESSEEALLQALKQSGRRRVGHAEIAAASPASAAPATTRVKLGEGAIPKFDVEADIQKTLAKKPPASSRQRAIIAVVLTVLVLAAVALIGMPLLTAATHMLGALPSPGAPVPGVLQL